MEERTIYVLQENFDIIEAVGYYDSLNGQLVVYHEKDCTDYYNPKDFNESYFDTLEEAEDARRESILKLTAQMPDVLKYVQRMDSLSENNDVRPFQRDEYLGRYGVICESYYKQQYYRLQGYVNQLKQYIRTGMITVRGITFRPKDVETIKWCRHNETPESTDGMSRDYVVIKIGDKIFSSYNDYDLFIVKMVFGENYSGRIYVEGV